MWNQKRKDVLTQSIRQVVNFRRVIIGRQQENLDSTSLNKNKRELNSVRNKKIMQLIIDINRKYKKVNVFLIFLFYQKLTSTIINYGLEWDAGTNGPTWTALTGATAMTPAT